MYRHATDVTSLVFGTIFAGFTVFWLLDVTDTVDAPDAWLAGPVILIAAGIVGLVVALSSSRERDETPPLPPPDAHSG